MAVENALYPNKQQIETLLSLPDNGPVCMVNLLKFREKAQYEDGRDCDLSGVEAYGLYAAQMRKFVEDQGGRFIYSATVDTLMIGKGDGDWDAVAIVEYPSRQAFVEIAMSPKVVEIGVHRAAGLDGQLLIATTQSGDALGG